jgi:hypothetical protein
MKKITNPQYPNLTKYLFSDHELDQILEQEWAGDYNQSHQPREADTFDVEQEMAAIDDLLNQDASHAYLPDHFSSSRSSPTPKVTTTDENYYFDLEAERQFIDYTLGKNPTSLSTATSLNPTQLRTYISEMETLLQKMKQLL